MAYRLILAQIAPLISGWQWENGQTFRRRAPAEGKWLSSP